MGTTDTKSGLLVAIKTRWQFLYQTRRVMTIFIVIASLFGLLFALKMPPLWGQDETTSYARAYEIANGQWATKKMPYPWGDNSFGDQIPISAYNLIWHVNDDITIDKYGTSYGVKHIDDLGSYSQFTDAKLNNPQTKDYFFPNSAVYSPLAYMPAAAAIKTTEVLDLSVGASITLARVLGLAFYIACVAFALNALRNSRFAWLVFVVALIPMNLFEASIISADLTVNALAIMLVGLVVKSLLAKKLTKSEIIAVTIAAVALPVVKPTYVFLSAAILLIPARAIVHYVVRCGWYKIATLALSGLLLVGWTYQTREVAKAFRLIGAGDRWYAIDVAQQIDFLLHHPLSFLGVMTRTVLLQDNTYLNGLVGSMSFVYVQVPAVGIVAVILALLLGVGISDRLGMSKRNLWLAGGIVVGCVGALMGSFYLTFTPVAEPIIVGVQGRYFLPMLLLAIAVLCAATTKWRMRLQAKDVAAYAWVERTIVGLALFTLAVTAIKLFYVLLG